jgi:hypothetical protein
MICSDPSLARPPAELVMNETNSSASSEQAPMYSASSVRLESRAVLHEIVVLALVDVVLGLPRAPRLDGVLDAPDHALGRRRRGRRAIFRRRPAQREAQPLAGLHRKGRAHRRVGDLERHGGAHGDPAGAERAGAAVLPPDQRHDQAVLRARRELHHKLDPAGDALDAAQHLVRRVIAEIMAASRRAKIASLS